MVFRLEDYAKVYGTVAQFITAIVAIVAVMGAYVQIQTVKANNKELTDRNRETAARQLFRSQLQLEFEQPKFAAAKYDEIRQGGDLELNRYRTFMAHLLFTCEEIMETMAANATWRHTCEGRFADHVRILCADATDSDLATFVEPIPAMVRAAMSMAGKNGVAECQKRVSG